MAKVLLIEDNPLNRKIHTRYLTDLAGGVIDVAENGQQALALIEVNNYEYIFLDIGLPDCEGTYVLSKIRCQEVSRKIVVVILTAHLDFEEHQGYLMSNGADAVLVKPIEKEQLKVFLKNTET